MLNTIIEIGDNTFSDCSNLQDIEFSNNLRIIGKEYLIMKKFNVILVYNKDDNKILMCKRKKVEKNEEELNAAYRELQEETGITNNDIKLTNIMNFQYKMSDMELEVYAGKLNKDITLEEEVNKLYWIDKKEDFFNMEKYAGEGNIGHMLNQAEIYKDKLF